MSHKNIFALAVSAATLTGTIITTTAYANPFEINQLTNSYQTDIQDKCGSNK